MAFYRPSTDSVQMPNLEAFDSAESYHSTLFHELTHSTGHPSRLKRLNADAPIAPFGSPDYSKEELVAEMGAAFLCAESGIGNVTLTSSASYIQNWLGALRNDKRMVVIAAAQAQKAADYILGREVK
jgi:antirestriction protein ArdC